MTAQHTSDYPTLGEVLRLPAFAGCIVCGGAAGLDRQVSGVNLTDTPDYARWLAQGELLITTGFAIADDPQAVDALLPTAMEKGLSGVGIKPGRYLPKPLSAELTEAADRLELPLLQLPDDVRFAELADTVSREIARRRIPTEQERQMALLLHHLVSGAPPSEAMERQAAESGIHLEYPHMYFKGNHHTAIIKKEDWIKVQKLLSERHSTAKRATLRRLSNHFVAYRVNDGLFKGYLIMDSRWSFTERQEFMKIVDEAQNTIK